jgi:anti-sigma B factor antagonist
MDFSVSYAYLSDDVAVVSVAGEVDVYRAPRVRAVLTERIDRGSRLVVVDLRQTTALDATGLGVLVGGHKRVRARRGALVVVTRQDRVLRQFRSTGLTRVLPVRPTLDQALAELARTRPDLLPHDLLPHPLDADGESVQAW